MTGTLEILREIGYAARSLKKVPGFLVAAVLTLGLGIGTNTAIFSLINAVILQPLPFPEPDRLVVVWEQRAREGTRNNAIAPGDYLDWRSRSHSFAALCGMDQRPVLVGGEGKPERVIATLVSSDFLATFRIQPVLGHAFDRAGEDEHVVLLADEFWQRRFARSPDVIGKTIRLNDEPYRIAGVIPAGFRIFVGFDADLYLPPLLTSAQKQDHGGHELLVIGRLRPGVGLAHAQAEMDAISRQMEREHPVENAGHSANLVPLRDMLTGKIKPALVILQVAVLFVLLIACANAANLSLARAAGRGQEIAIRRALGAGSGQIVRIFLAEGLLISGLGGGLGVFLARLGLRLIPLLPSSLEFSNVPGLLAARLDVPVLLFALGLCLLTSLVVGLLPARQLSSVDLAQSLRGGRVVSGSGAGHKRWRRALVIAEVAVAFPLLTGAVLLVDSFARLVRVNPGFKATGRLSFGLSLSPVRYREPARQQAFYRELLQGISRLPSIRSAALTTLTPGSTWGPRWGLLIDGRPRPRTLEEWPKASWRIISNGYLSTMGIPVLRGRGFSLADTANSEKVILLSQTTVKRFWGDKDPIGTRVAMAHDPVWRTVIGITGDVKYLGLDKDPEPEFYLPVTQYPVPGLELVLVAWARDNPSGAVPEIEREIASIDPELPVGAPKITGQLLAQSTGPQRVNAALFGAFAGIAYLLAAVGLYGVMAYLVTQRTAEIGIRVALGARRRHLLTMVLLDAAVLATAGLAIGCGLAYTLTPALNNLLFGVAPRSTLGFLSVAVALLLVALTASLQPAIRATQVDPAVALRAE